MSATEAHDFEDVRFQSNYRVAERLHRLIGRADDWAYDARRGWLGAGRFVLATRSKLEAQEEATFRLGQLASALGDRPMPPPAEGRRRLRVV